MSLQSASLPQLERLKQDLQTHIPSDPTFMAAAGTMLRMILDDFIPAARERHEQLQKEQAAEQEQQQAETQAQQEAQSPGETTPTPDDDSHASGRRRRG